MAPASGTVGRVDGERAHEAVLAEAERTLDDVEHALHRLEQGTYGTCAVCGEPIDEARLETMPAARTCGGHPQLTDPPPPPATEPPATPPD